MNTLSRAKRIVIKIGTSTLTYETGRINIRRFEGLCKVLSDIKNSGREVVLVSSGAVGVGVAKLGLPCRPKDTPSKQAAAAVGQCELMYLYDKLFLEKSHKVAQVLLTRDVVEVENRAQNIESIAGGSGSGLGTGGMSTKIQAAKIATSHGIPMAIINGSDPNLLYDLLDGIPVGSLFLPAK